MPPRIVTVMAAGLLALALALAALGSDARAPAPPSTAPTATASAVATPTTAPTATETRPIPDGYRIQIFRLGIDLPIHEGSVERDIDRQETPEHAAFHLPGTAIPGEPGNTYLYAHARQGMFLALWDARPGDEVLISTPDLQVLRYEVTEVHPRVPPDDTSWVEPTDDERLTLQTSTGPEPRDPRFVVIAIRR